MHFWSRIVFYNIYFQYLHTGQFTFSILNQFSDDDLLKLLRFGQKYLPGGNEDEILTGKLFDNRVILETVFKLYAQSLTYKLKALETMTQNYIKQ